VLLSICSFLCKCQEGECIKENVLVDWSNLRESKRIIEIVQQEISDIHPFFHHIVQQEIIDIHPFFHHIVVTYKFQLQTKC